MSSLAFLNLIIPGIILGTLLFFSAGGDLLGLRAQQSSALARRHVVEIHDFRFEPAQLDVAPGDTVVWINRDIVPHTATRDNESWDSGMLLNEADMWSLVAPERGLHTYYCRFHPTMKGVLLVK